MYNREQVYKEVKDPEAQRAVIAYWKELEKKSPDPAVIATGRHLYWWDRALQAENKLFMTSVPIGALTGAVLYFAKVAILGW